jgi:hypothetical protein
MCSNSPCVFTDRKIGEGPAGTPVALGQRTQFIIANKRQRRAKPMANLDFHYCITPDQGERIVFSIVLDRDSLKSPCPVTTERPHWTQLGFQQCSNCPLDPTEVSHCPIAVRLAPLADRLGNLRSYDRLNLEVTSKRRVVSARASAQEIVGSLMGLIIATSGCPHTELFRPMARFHLPLAEPGETFYRVASMYRLAQYYRDRAGLDVDPGFDKLGILYERMEQVNLGIQKRLSAATQEDAALNAIARLGAIATLVPISIEEEIEEFKSLFSVFLNDQEEAG